MKVLVVGSTGQLARCLAERAEHRAGLVLVALGRPDLDLEITGTAEAAIRRVGPDAIINAAAFTDVDGAEEDPARAFRINAEAAGEVAKAALALDRPVVHISTDYVFDGSALSAYSEDATCNPLGVYGQSKLAGEERVRAANPASVIVRSAWIYSPFGHNFVKTMFEAAEQRNTLSVVADQRGSPTSALDLADGLLTLIEHWRGGERTGQGEIYHIAGSGEASWHDLAHEVMDCRAKLGLRSSTIDPIRSDQWPVRARRPRNSVLDSRKFERDFGFRLPDWRPSVAEVVNRLAAKR